MVYFQKYIDVSESNNIEKTFTLIEVVRISLVAAHSKFPEAVNNEVYRTIVKKNLISQGTTAIIKLDRDSNSAVSLGFAVALMLIDSYAPSCPVPPGNFDERDAKELLRNVDILNGLNTLSIK